MIRGRLTERISFPVENGSKMHNTYQIKIDKTGHKTLHKTGESNWYEKTQAALEDTLIENILMKASMGDMSALNRIEGKFLDTTEMPTNLAEAQRAMYRLRTEFEKLPVEIRAQFDHSPEVFINEYGTERFFEKMGMIDRRIPEGTITAENVKEETANE